jgi:hypothetical protein
VKKTKVSQEDLQALAADRFDDFAAWVKARTTPTSTKRTARVPCPRCMSNGKSMKNLVIEYEVEGFDTDDRTVLAIARLLFEYSVAKPAEKHELKVLHQPMAQLTNAELAAIASGEAVYEAEFEEIGPPELPPAA